jgi:VCBS repeat protein
VDGNGSVDLLTMGFFDGGLQVFSRDEQGAWSPSAQLLTQLDFGMRVLAKDIDGDRSLEILAATNVGPRVWSHSKLPSSAPQDASSWQDRSKGLVAPEVGGADLGIDAADLDGDGRCELLVSGMVYPGHAPLQVFRWDGDSWKPWGEGLPADEAFFDGIFAQLDGTGPPEIVAAGKYGIRIVAMTEPGRFTDRGRLDGSRGVFNVCAGDVDRDGRDEIVYVGFNGVQVLKPWGSP